MIQRKLTFHHQLALLQFALENFEQVDFPLGKSHKFQGLDLTKNSALINCLSRVTQVQILANLNLNKKIQPKA